MDLPSNHHPLPPLITIRGLMLPRTSPTGPHLPPLVSIQGFTTAAVHDLPQAPQQIDVGQLLQAANSDSRRKDLEEQRVLAGLQEAQITYESLEALSQDHRLKMKEIEDSTREGLQESERLRLKLTSTLKQVEQERAVLQALRGEVLDLHKLQAQLAHLKEMNAQLMEEARAIDERCAEATKLRSQLTASLHKAEKLGGEALHERDAEIHKLRSQLTASKEKAKKVEGEAETLRNHNNKLRSSTETATLKSQLADSVGKSEQLEKEVEALQNNISEAANLKSQLVASEEKAEQLKREVEALQNNISEAANLKSQLVASEEKAEQLKREVEALQNNISEAANLKSQLVASEEKAEQFKREAEALHNDNTEAATEATNLKSQLAVSEGNTEQLKREAEALRNDIVEISKLKSEAAALDSNVERLEREVEALRNDNCKLHNDHDDLRKQNDKLRNGHDEMRKENDGLHKENDELLKGNGKLSNGHDDLRQENDKLRQEKDKLTNGHDDLRQENDKLRQEKDKLTNGHDDLRQENDKLRQEKDKLLKENEKLNKLRDGYEELCKEKEDLRQEIEKLNKLRDGYEELCKEKEDLRQEIDKLRPENDKLCQENDELRKENDKLEQHLDTGHIAVIECKRLDAELKEVNTSKRFYLEKYLSLRGAIRAVCRIRAASGSLKPEEEGFKFKVSNDAQGASLEVFRKGKSSLADAAIKSATWPRKAWRLDQIFSASDNNDVIWEEIRPLLESAIDGAQVVVILYGRTGTGKSFTSEGIWSHLGESLFADTKDSSSSSSGSISGDEGAESPREEQIRLWSTEVYCGELHDLLVTTKKKGPAHAGKLDLPNSQGILNPVLQCGASSVVVLNREGLDEVLGQVSRARISGQTRANDKSSRSHSFTCVELPGGGSITLVDLAGHERDGVGSSPAELHAINKSLSALTQALGKLVTSLHKADRRAPRGEAGQQVTANKPGKKNKKAKSQATPPRGHSSPPGKATPPGGNGSPPGQNTTPDKTSPTKGIESVWSSPELLPRIVGALMLRGSRSRSQHGELELKSKVMFLATLDFSTLESAKGSEQTLESLQHAGLITGE